jgi:hypothetical protein
MPKEPRAQKSIRRTGVDDTSEKLSCAHITKHNGYVD